MFSIKALHAGYNHNLKMSNTCLKMWQCTDILNICGKTKLCWETSWEQIKSGEGLISVLCSILLLYLLGWNFTFCLKGRTAVKIYLRARCYFEYFYLRKKQHKAAENETMKNFIICTFHKIFLGWWS